MAGNPIYSTAQWKALRKQVLEGPNASPTNSPQF